MTVRHIGFFRPEMMFPFGLLLFLLFWGAVVWLIVVLVRGRDFQRPPPMSGPAHPPRQPALDVLEERYARGEITREEFTERRDVLLGRPPPRADSPPPAPPS